MKEGKTFDHFSPKRWRSWRRGARAKRTWFEGGGRFPSWVPCLPRWSANAKLSEIEERR